MINFRFHVVSVIAVIVAVAAGLVLGTVVQRAPVAGTARADVEATRDRQRDRPEQVVQPGDGVSAGQRPGDGVSAGQPLADELASTILNGRLAHRRVIVVTAPNMADDVAGVESMLAAGGATVSGRLELTDQFLDPQRRDSLRDLAIASRPAGVPEGPPATTDGVAATAALFGAVLLRRNTAVPDDEVRSVLTAYVSHGFLTGLSGVSASADAIVVLADPPSTSDSAVATPEGTLAALVSGLSALGPVVAAGSGAEPGTVVGRLRADQLTAARVSTVDNLPTPQGKLATAWALADQLAGRVGHYGNGPAAVSPLPPLTPPVPVVVPVPDSTASPEPVPATGG